MSLSLQSQSTFLLPRQETDKSVLVHSAASRKKQHHDIIRREQQGAIHFGHEGRSTTPALEKRGNWRDTLQTWGKRQFIRFQSTFEHNLNWVRKNVSMVIMAFAAIFSILPMPDCIRNFIHHKFFFAPHKISSVQLLKDQDLEQSILELNFHPPGKNTHKLNAWYIEAEDNKPTVIYSHGRNTNISHLEPMLAALKRKGYGIFAYDYPGFGCSEGKPDEKALYEAGLAASQFLANGRRRFRVPFNEQIIMGHSLGGAVAVDVAKTLSANPETRPKALVVVNTFTNLKEAFSDKKQAFNWFIQRLFDKKKKIRLVFDSIEKIKAVKVPVMVLHGEKDKTINPQLGRKLFQKVTDPRREFAILPGVKHSLREPDCNIIATKLNQFLNKVNSSPLDRTA